MKKIMSVAVWLMLIILAVLFSGCSNNVSTLEENSIVHNDLYCDSAQDCVITSYVTNVCCGDCTSYPINKVGLDKQIEWQANNCDADSCPINDCYDEKMPVPACENNVCTIVLNERT